MALALNEAEADAVYAGPLLACCAALLVAFPWPPVCFQRRWRRAFRKRRFRVSGKLAAGRRRGRAAWLLESRGRRLAAVLLIAAGAAAGTVYLKWAAAPELDRTVSARALWRQISGRAEEVCIDQIERSWRYGLNYYSGTPLPECSQHPGRGGYASLRQAALSRPCAAGPRFSG